MLALPTGDIEEDIIHWLAQSDNVHLGLVPGARRAHAAHGGAHRLVEGAEVGRVQGGVRHAVLVLLRPRPRPGQPQQQVVAEEQQQQLHGAAASHSAAGFRVQPQPQPTPTIPC